MSVIDIAKKLGYEIGHTGHDILGCPNCKAVTRHTKSRDSRGAVGVKPRTLESFVCFQCEAGGTTRDFIAYHKYGKRFSSLSLEEKRGLGELHTTTHTPPASRPAPPRYVPKAELRRYIGYLYPLAASAAAQNYLQDRWGQPIKLEALRGLTGAWGGILDKAAEPRWAQGWADQGRYIHLGLYDDNLCIRSILARSVRGVTPKGVSPTGYNRSGLFMYQPGREDLVVIAEGEVDFLAWSLLCEQKPTVIGVVSGSVTEKMVTKVLPSYAHVVVATDWDKQGDEYYRKIRKLRRDVTRWKKRSPMQQITSLQVAC